MSSKVKYPFISRLFAFIFIDWPFPKAFSGGVSNEGKYLLDLLYDYCHARYFGFRGSPEPKLIQAVLGYQAGMIGAAALFF